MDKTVTFGYNKIGMLCGMGKIIGTIVVKDIGFVRDKFVCDNILSNINTFSINMEDVCQLPKHKPDYDKGKCGKHLCAGSKDMCSAACLSARAAFRSGCGFGSCFYTYMNNKNASDCEGSRGNSRYL